MINSQLKETLESGGFAFTAELAPPKGIDYTRIISIAESLKGKVDAINVTDFQSATVKASSLSLCIELEKRGLQPVLQLTGRDRNRIAIQGELLSAAHFNIQNILALTGDHTTTGDNKDAKPVFEFGSIEILQTAEELMKGRDLGGNDLTEPFPEYYLGAVVTPIFNPLKLQIMQMRKKIKAGAQFFQTQALFDIEDVKKFNNQLEGIETKILIGVIPLKSPGMARFMNRAIPGIQVPESLIERLEKAEDKVQEGLVIAANFIKELKQEKLANGAHIMAIGNEHNIAKIIDMANSNE